MKRLMLAFSLIAITLTAAACGTKQTVVEGKVIKTMPAGNGLTVSLLTKDGVLKHGNTEFMISFADTTGKTVDVGAAALTFHMPQMGTMAEMNDAARLTTTETPGVYRGAANLGMTGEWQLKVTYDGAAGRGETSFPITAQ